MDKVIHLHEVDAALGDNERLNLFAGRHLGEREFDIRQAYADQRLADLLAERRPGIVSGLEVSHDPDTDAIRVQPGTAVAPDGEAIRLFFPLDTDWQDVVTTYQSGRTLRPAMLLEGYFFLTLNRVVYLEEDSGRQEACTRDELDPLRDRTVETAAFVSLQPVLTRLPPGKVSQPRAANRICVDHLQRSPFRDDSSAVPLALLYASKRKLVWLDPVAGRYEAHPDAAHRTLLAHYQQVAASIAAAAVKKQTLGNTLGVDYLPSAGPLPAHLVSELAGGPTPGAKQREDWLPPKLGFLPEDLQMELVPVALSDVLPTLRREMTRGPLDLVHGLGERLRVMAAIPDSDFRADLLDLPDIDQALIDELQQRGDSAYQAYLSWRYLHDTLYQGLSESELADRGAPGLDPPPLAPKKLIAALVKDRQDRLKPKEKLPPPYYWEQPELAANFPKPSGDEVFDGESLYAQEIALQAQIDWLDRELDANDKLLGEFDSFLSLQRQQVDSVTVSFANLAGGVPGDGSGLKLARWTPHTRFSVALTPKED